MERSRVQLGPKNRWRFLAETCRDTVCRLRARGHAFFPFYFHFYDLPLLPLAVVASSPSFFLVAGRAKTLLSPPAMAFQKP